MFAAVVDRKDLPHPFIIGRSILGLDINWQITITKQGSGAKTGEAGESISQVVQERAQDPVTSQHPPAQQPTEQSLQDQQPTYHLPAAPTLISSTPSCVTEILDIDYLSTVDIAAVRTRAQAKRQQQQQQEDAAATALSTAPITPVEAIPDLEDSNPADRPGKESQEGTATQQTPPTTSHPADIVEGEDNT